jgi:hypothetical protein
MIKIADKIYVSLPRDVGVLGSGKFVVYCAKVPFHKEAVGYKNCCPAWGDTEYNIAMRQDYCALNVLNATDVNRVNKEAILQGLEAAESQYLLGKNIVFVDNMLDGVAPLMAGVFACGLGMHDLTYQELLGYLTLQTGTFKPKNSIAAVFGAVYSNYTNRWRTGQPTAAGEYLGFFKDRGLESEQPLVFSGREFKTHPEGATVYPAKWKLRKAVV